MPHQTIPFFYPQSCSKPSWNSRRNIHLFDKSSFCLALEATWRLTNSFKVYPWFLMMAAVWYVICSLTAKKEVWRCLCLLFKNTSIKAVRKCQRPSYLSLRSYFAVIDDLMVISLPLDPAPFSPCINMHSIVKKVTFLKNNIYNFLDI